MITTFSKSPFKQFLGVTYFNRWRLIKFIVLAEIAYTLRHTLGMHWIELPVVPVTILGGALAIFLGFRNSSAYDRWWEARKIWGAIVNDSRTFTVLTLNYIIPTKDSDSETIKALQKRMVYRHLAWIYTLKSNLRKQEVETEKKQWLEEADLNYLDGKSNVPSQILALQTAEIKQAYEAGLLSDFRYVEMGKLISRMYDWQGKCERIKNTIFPYYYNYFTRLFLWVFMACLPFALVSIMEWIAMPLSVAISFVFGILEKTGIVTENPFEGRAADTPMTSLCRTIEIDLREMLGDENIPAPAPNKEGRFGVLYKD